jgi:16S rRNA (cytosine967-C5)-methyltransferase
LRQAKTLTANVSPARRAAFDVLMTVERGSAHSDELLRGKAVGALSTGDRNLATTLVLGVLRWQIRLDYELQGLLKRPNARLDAEVQVALRMGAFQLLFLDRVPAHAAIDESVELAKRAGHRFASGMVNAVLRRVASDAAPRVEYSEKTAAELALAFAHPEWMVERWAKFYGPESTRAICRNGQMEPASVVRLSELAVEEELARAGVECGPGELITAARIVRSGDAASTEAVPAGRVRFQDEGSQLIAEIAAAASAAPIRTALDACAAPGGKTLILAERNPEAQIVACEANPQRLARLRERLAGYEGRIECRLADAAGLTEEAVFDVVLVDAPCSGTGTLGRNPEIRHRLRAEDLARQAERQRAILQAGLRAVRPGGCVVYSTCSLEPEENEQVVAAVLAETANARQISLESSIDSLRGRGILVDSAAERLRGCLTPEGALRLLPGAFHGDGFFIALLERIAAEASKI